MKGDLIVCPGCKSADATKDKSLETLAEPVNGGEPQRVTMDVMICGNCHLEFLISRGRRKYQVVSRTSFGSLLKELEEAHEENDRLTIALSVLDKKRTQLNNEIVIERMQDEVTTMEGSVDVVESDLITLGARRDLIRTMLAAAGLNWKRSQSDASS